MNVTWTGNNLLSTPLLSIYKIKISFTIICMRIINW